jgi:adenylylsulfate kinase
MKGLTWRVTASVTTMLIVFLMTGNLALVASVGLADITIKIFFYYCHERLWGRVHWGLLGTEPRPK